MWRLVVPLICGVVLLIFGWAESITITAHDSIKTYVLNGGVGEPAPIVIPSGTIIAGTGCENLTHYLAWRVKYQGQTLYLLEGDYSVERHSFIGTWTAAPVFGCR